MYCKNCNGVVQKDWSFSPHCGSRIERIKINLSNSTVTKVGTLRSLDYESYTCRDVDMCYHIDCDDCIFGKDDIFTLEEIKKKLIRED